VEEARTGGICTVEFSGGDIFCRKDIFEILGTIRGLGMDVTIPTKYPLNREMVMRLETLAIDTIQISIDAIAPDVLSFMVGTSGYADKIKKTFDFLEDSAIKVRTNTVLTPYNTYSLEGLLAFLASHKNIFRVQLTPYTRSLFRPREDLLLKPEECTWIDSHMDLFRQKHPDLEIIYSGSPADEEELTHEEKAKNFEKRSMCTANKWGIVVLPDGKVTVCEELYYHPDFIIGDLSVQSIKEAWNSDKALNLLQCNQESIPDGPCSTCRTFYECRTGLGYCFRDSMKAYGIDKYFWPDPKCPNAPPGNRIS
jgi:radical SAM protein with 4Fe4S-binding SPASM domain